MTDQEAERAACRRARAGLAAAAALAVVFLTGGCAIPFGAGGDGTYEPEPGRRSNQIYLEEQQRIERNRQSFGDQFPSER